ncbi:heme-degrading, partial [Rhizoctonia solani]
MAMIATSSKMSDAEIVQEVFEQASKLDDLTRVDLLTHLNQEATLRFPSFTSNDAFQIGSIIRAKFLAKHLPYSAFKAESTISSIASTVSSDEDKLPEWANRGIVVSISTFTGHTLFACTVGAESEVTPDNWVWVEGKRNVVKRFNHSSYYMGRKLAAAGKTQEAANLPFPEYATHGGAFPVWLQNAPSSPVAVIVVSGLPQRDDHMIIVETLREYIPTLSH